MKKLFYLINAKVLFLLMLMTVLFTACSEQDSKSSGNSGIEVSSYYPVDVSPTALHERITVQFNRVSGIGAEDTDACLPYYDIKIGTDDNINNALDLGTVEPNDSLLVRFADKWDNKYPTISRMWKNNWENISTLFAYPDEIRRVIYTTNAIESLNSVIRKAVNNKKIFPDDQAAFKAVFLAIKQASKKWTMPIRNWKPALNRFEMEYGN